MKYQTHNRDRFERLQSLSPIDAVRAWLDGEFGTGEESAMMSAIRRDDRVKGSDTDIFDTICDAMVEELGAEDCMNRLSESA